MAGYMDDFQTCVLDAMGSYVFKVEYAGTEPHGSSAADRAPFSGVFVRQDAGAMNDADYYEHRETRGYVHTDLVFRTTRWDAVSYAMRAGAGH